MLEPKRLGRPDAQGSEALDRHILSTATRLFTEQGYAATSIEQIAVLGGVGKQTIYRRYASKEELFKAVISDLSRTLVALAARAESFSTDPLLALREAGRALIEMTARPDVVAIYRVLIAESGRFPAFVDHAMSDASEPIHRLIGRLLRASREAGRIRADCDDEAASRALTGLLTGWSLQQSLLGQKGLTDEAEREAFFETAWTIFLRGVAVRS